jgi:hypothetical protein
MFIVLYTVKKNICVYTICPTSCCLCDTLMDPWNMCVCVCVCACVRACMYVGRYVYTSQKMAIYIVTMLTSNLVLFAAGHIECSIFSSMGVRYLTMLLVNCCVYVASMEHD